VKAFLFQWIQNRYRISLFFTLLMMVTLLVLMFLVMKTRIG